MNGWQFLLVCFNWIGGKSSRIINVTAGVVSILAVASVIPVKWSPWLTLATSILGYLRAQFVSNTVDQAKAILASNSPKEGKS